MPPVLEAIEHALDDIARLVEPGVVVNLNLAVFAWWDARGRAGLGDPVAQVVCVIAAICDDRRALPYERLKALTCLRNIGFVACRERDGDRPAIAITDEVQLGIQPAFGLADGTTFGGVFLTPLAAMRCVLTWLASIINTEKSAPSLASASKIRAKTPASDQRL